MTRSSATLLPGRTDRCAHACAGSQRSRCERSASPRASPDTDPMPQPQLGVDPWRAFDTPALCMHLFGPSRSASPSDGGPGRALVIARPNRDEAARRPGRPGCRGSSPPRSSGRQSPGDGRPREEGCGSCEQTALLLQAGVLAPKLSELLPLGARELVVAFSTIELVLLDPVAQRLLGGPEPRGTSLTVRPEKTNPTDSRRNSGGYAGRDFDIADILSQLAPGKRTGVHETRENDTSTSNAGSREPKTKREALDHSSVTRPESSTTAHRIRKP